MKPERQKVIDRANSVFNDSDKAMIWLNSPCFSLGNQVPIKLIDSPEGMDLVMDALGRIEQGVFI